MLSGEWWIDDFGSSTFADGDVSVDNHATIALQAALEIDLEDPRIPEIVAFEPLSDAAVEYLKEHGVSEKAIEYFKDGSDPRDYALAEMGWIRIHGDNLQVQVFDDEALDRIRGSEVWENVEDPEKLETSNETVNIEELKSGRFVTVPYRVLFDSSMSAARILSYGERAAPGQKEDEGFSVYANPGSKSKQCLTQEGVEEVYRVLDAVDQAVPVLGGNDPVTQEARMEILREDGPSDEDVFMDEDEIELPLEAGLAALAEFEENEGESQNPFGSGKDVFLGPYLDPRGKVPENLMAAPYLLKAMRRTSEPRITADEMYMTPGYFLSQNPKLIKSAKRLGVFTPGLMLSPHLASGFRNLCVNASVGCSNNCLNIAGQGDMGVGTLEELMSGRTNATQESRRRRTILFTYNPEDFKDILERAVAAALRLVAKGKFKFALRMNTLSDWPWEAEHFGRRGQADSVMSMYPDAMFYDYTKVGARMSKFLQHQNGQQNNWPSNYHLTYSLSEINLRAVLGVLRSGGSVAIAFDDSLGYAAGQRWHEPPSKERPILPPRWFGYPVIDGDIYDYRPADRKIFKIPEDQGFIVGLRIKGAQQRNRHREMLERAAGYGGEYGLPPEIFTFFQHAEWWEYTEHDPNLVEAMLRVSDLRAASQKEHGFMRGGAVGPGSLSLRELLPHLFSGYADAAGGGA